MKQQRIENFTGNDLNSWLAGNNNNGWYIKEIIKYVEFIYGGYDCVFLLEKEIEDE